MTTQDEATRLAEEWAKGHYPASRQYDVVGTNGWHGFIAGWKAAITRHEGLKWDPEYAHGLIEEYHDSNKHLAERIAELESALRKISDFYLDDSKSQGDCVRIARQAIAVREDEKGGR